MATYIVLNIMFMLTVIGVLKYYGALRWDRIMTRVMVLLFVLTALFDSLLIAAEIVAYDTQKILQIYIGKAPVEDFMYAVLALILVPAVWKKLGGGQHAPKD